MPQPILLFVVIIDTSQYIIASFHPLLLGYHSLATPADAFACLCDRLESLFVGLVLLCRRAAFELQPTFSSVIPDAPVGLVHLPFELTTTHALTSSSIATIISFDCRSSLGTAPPPLLRTAHRGDDPLTPPTHALTRRIKQEVRAQQEASSTAAD